jgi:hypothetical protein
MKITFNELAALAAGGLFTITALRKRADRVKLMDGGLRATGEVVKIDEVPSSDNSASTYKPVIQFTTVSKQVITKAVETSTNPCPYRVGQKLVVFYDRDKAEHFALDDGPSISIEITMFAVGIIALIVAAVLFFTTE